MRDTQPATQGANTQSRGRSSRVSVRLNPQVQELLKAVAEAEGISPSALVREAIERRLGLTRKRGGSKLPPLSRLTNEDRKAIQKFTAAVNRQGVNINQIARNLNSEVLRVSIENPPVTAGVRVPLSRVLQSLDQTRQAIEEFTKLLDEKLGGES